MNYTIVGNDGKTYGPVDAAQIRIWLKQSRVDNRTPIFVAGTTDWTFLGLLPEFAADFAGSPPVISATRPAMVSPVAMPARTNGLALWGFICSLLAWTICCCFPLSLLGLVFSILGLVQVNASNGTQEGRGLAIAGICISGAHLLWSSGFMLLGLLDQPSQVMWNLPT